MVETLVKHIIVYPVVGIEGTIVTFANMLVYGNNCVLAQLAIGDSALPCHQVKLTFTEGIWTAGPVGCGAGTTNASDGRSQQGEVQHASDPAHGLWVWLRMLLSQEGS